MRKILTCFFLLILSSNCYSQWTTLNSPSSGRYDDIFFLNENVGWAASGYPSVVLKTTNGGINWAPTSSVFQGKYLRSIEFATSTLGFCGSLDSALYRTTDGGNTWTNITNLITPKPPGVCGLSAPTPNVIYGSGKWCSPAYIIKSTDGGNTWTTINMSQYASALIDIHFISADTGFVSGAANPATDGGVILYTTDGGASWAIKHKTLVNEDRIWKLQSPDKINFYGSVEAIPSTGNVRIVKSTDKGMTWTTKIVSTSYNQMQTIGFLDSQKGWTGGGYGGPGSPTPSVLFETTDGGNTWSNITLGHSYNRFFKVNDSTAFLSGEKIYKYQKGLVNGITAEKTNINLHSLNVSPNPASDKVNIEQNIHHKTYAKLQLFSAEGKLLQTIFDDHIDKGKRLFSISIKDYSPQILFLTLKTNEGLIYKKIIKN